MLLIIAMLPLAIAAAIDAAICRYAA